MFLRVAALCLCPLILGCEASPDHTDESEVYVSALEQLVPTIDHFNIAAEKVDFGPGDSVPGIEQVLAFGTFSFPDSERFFTADDFPGLGVTLLYEKDFDQLKSGDCESFWTNFRSTYRQGAGFFRFSAVGFDDTGTKAIFYVASHGGCLSGQGTLVIMTLEGDRWVVAESELLWVS